MDPRGLALTAPAAKFATARLECTSLIKRNDIVPVNYMDERQEVVVPSLLRRKLLRILRDKALGTHETPIRLSSGALSTDFVDGKKGLCRWKDLYTAAEAIMEAVEDAGIDFDAVGGPTMGADALAVGIAAASDSRWFFIRKQPKEHGTGRRIEGARIGSGDRVLLVDDVVTTGGSILEAVDVVRETGATIAGAVTLVDRSELAGPEMTASGVRYLPMATYEDLDIKPVGRGIVTAAAS